MEKKSLLEIINDGECAQLLAIAAATELAKEICQPVLTDRAWPEEVTGQEQMFKITATNQHKAAFGVVCRPSGFPVRVPLTYRVAWK